MAGVKGRSGGARKGAGKKKFKIDYETCEKLASLMCTQAEIASYLGCSLALLEHDKKFQEVHRKGLDKGKMSVRRHQYRCAEEGNPTMLIWWGKQYLGQRDMKDIKMETTNIVVDIEEDDDDENDND